GAGEHVRAVGDGVFEATLGELGVMLDADATLARASAIGHKGSPLRRLRDALRARRHRVDIEPVWAVDEARAREALAAVASAAQRDAIDAKIDLDRHEKTAEREGEEIDVDASLEALRAASYGDDQTSIELAVRARSPRVTAADLAMVDVSKVVASH